MFSGEQIGKEVFMEETITITKDEYDELIEDRKFLDCLRSAGVDNWEGYDFAIEMFNEE
jgi:phage pi2 protein 07